MIMDEAEELLICDDNNSLVGIISFKDVYRLIIQNINEDTTIDNYMTRKVITIGMEENLNNCLSIMRENEIGRIPVLEKGEIIGIIRKTEIMEYIYSGFEESEIKINHTLNSINEAICVVDKDGKVVLWNKKSEELYDVSADEIIGNYIADFFPDAILSNVLKTKQPLKNVRHSPKKDYDVVITATPIWINEKLIGAVSTDRDITEVERLSKELQKANDTLKFLENEVNRFSNHNSGSIISNNKKMIEKIYMAKKVAKSEVSVLITGESGTGKEIFARLIHEYSEKRGLFIPVNCSAIPTELFESEFFGYEHGAFTGASRKGKSGLFELAQDGTIFLDEIGDLPMFMQAKLLRVLQEGQIKKVGGEDFISVNARVVSATNKDLSKMVETGEFREDLYYRVNVVEITLPPLRERGEDVLLLIHNFLKEISEKNNREIPTIDSETLRILQNYGWKGNIRELKNTIEHLVVLCQNNHITKDIIPQYIINNIEMNCNMREESLDLNQSVKQLEIRLIREALEYSGGSKIEAAKLLNISRPTLYYKMDNYKIDQ